MTRLGGLFGRGRNEDEEPARTPWTPPPGVRPVEEEEPGGVRVLPPDDGTSGFPGITSPPARPEPDPATRFFETQPENRGFGLPEPQRYEPVIRPFGSDYAQQAQAAPASPPPPPPSQEPAFGSAFSDTFVAPRAGQDEDDLAVPEEYLPSAESDRLERWLSLMAEQAKYYQEAGELLGRESNGLLTYLQQQRANMQRLLLRLEEQIKPLKQYLATEQANLDRVQEQMASQPAGLVSNRFAEYFRLEQERIEKGREEIEARYLPFREYFAEQQHLVETLLGRFDEDFRKLGQTLAEQKKLLDRIQGGFSDEQFSTGVEFLVERQRSWVDFSRGQGEDAAQVYERLALINDAFASVAKGNTHLERLLTVAREGDGRLAEYVPPVSTVLPAEPEPEPRRRFEPRPETPPAPPARPAPDAAAGDAAEEDEEPDASGPDEPQGRLDLGGDDGGDEEESPLDVFLRNKGKKPA